LAAKFRDELMPGRGKLHRERSPIVTISRVSEGWGALLIEVLGVHHTTEVLLLLGGS
jgi:hypothetical protein